MKLFELILSAVLWTSVQSASLSHVAVRQSDEQTDIHSRRIKRTISPRLFNAAYVLTQGLYQSHLVSQITILLSNIY